MSRVLTSPWFTWVALGLGLLAQDLWLRWPVIRDLQGTKEWGGFAGGHILRLCCVYLLLRLLQVARRGPHLLHLFCTGCLALLVTFLLFFAYGFHAHFNMAPNVYAASYVMEEWHDAIALTRPYIPWFLGGAGAMWGLLILLARSPLGAQRLPPRIGGWRGAFLFSLLTLIMQNTAHFHPRALPLDTAAGFAFIKAVHLKILGTSQVRTFAATPRLALEPVQAQLPFSILLIIHESVRAKSLKLFNASAPWDGMPHLSRRLTAPGSTGVLFSHAYANSVSTITSVPSLLSGINPAQPLSTLHLAPLIFDYGKAFQQVFTFYISSHSFRWANFQQFLAGSKIDVVWSSESTGGSFDLDTTASDEETAAQLTQQLATRPLQEKFVGVLQFYGSHSPYQTGDVADTAQTKVLPEGRYLRSLRAVDEIQEKVLRFLADSGRLENTLVIGTSDHGEAFGEHGHLGHMQAFYDEEAQIPLWFLLPRRLVKEAAVLASNTSQTVSNTDLVPTLVDLFGRVDAGFAEQTKHLQQNFLGASLLQALPESRVILQKTNFERGESSGFVNGFGAVTGADKIMFHMTGKDGRFECYNRERDPAEKISRCDLVPLTRRMEVAEAIRRWETLKNLVHSQEWQTLFQPTEDTNK